MGDRIIGQNGDIDRSKYDENEENDYQTEKNRAQILRCTLKKQSTRKKKIMFQKRKINKWTPRV